MTENFIDIVHAAAEIRLFICIDRYQAQVTRRLRLAKRRNKTKTN